MLVSVNRKAQITLPKAVRERLNIHEGDILELEVRGEQMILRLRVPQKLIAKPVSAKSLDPLVGIINWGGNALEDSESIYDNS